MDETLFDIENGNICALCEHTLNWLADASEEETPIPLTIKRAICKPCFEQLVKKYFHLVKEALK